MMELTQVLESIIGPLAGALLNGLWQGALIAVLAAALLRWLPLTASGRYGVLYLALAVITCIPFVHLAGELWPAQSIAMVSTGEEMVTVLAAPMPVTPLRETAEPLIPLPLRVETGTAVMLVLLFWCTVAMALCVRIVAGYFQLWRVKQDSERVAGRHAEWWQRWTMIAPSARGPELRTSEVLRLPVAAGLGRPAILFPKRLLRRLTEEEAFGIWLHELAHILRLDDWTKFGQKLAEAIFFYHPAVRWIGRRLDLEREIACDEWAVARTGSAKPYATCLAKLAEFASVPARSLPAPAMASDRKQIFRRVEMLIKKNKKSTNTESRVTGPFAVSLLLAVAVSPGDGAAGIRSRCPPGRTGRGATGCRSCAGSFSFTHAGASRASSPAGSFSFARVGVTRASGPGCGVCLAIASGSARFARDAGTGATRTTGSRG